MIVPGPEQEVKGLPSPTASIPKRSDEAVGECLLIYDGRCRMCVTAKRGLDRLQSEENTSSIRMIAYQSGEARQALGDLYRPGRPDAAFLVGPQGKVARGLDAFLLLLPGLRGGRVLAALFRVPLIKPLGYGLYRLIAKYRYRLFGEVPLESTDVTAGGKEVDRR